MDRVGEQEETGGLESTRNTPRGLPLQNGNSVSTACWVRIKKESRKVLGAELGPWKGSQMSLWQQGPPGRWAVDSWFCALPGSSLITGSPIQIVQ